MEQFNILKFSAFKLDLNLNIGLNAFKQFFPCYLYYVIKLKIKRHILNIIHTWGCPVCEIICIQCLHCVWCFFLYLFRTCHNCFPLLKKDIKTNETTIQYLQGYKNSLVYSCFKLIDLIKEKLYIRNSLPIFVKHVVASLRKQSSSDIFSFRKGFLKPTNVFIIILGLPVFQQMHLS